MQPVAGWRSARPHLAGDLPAGPVADRVASVIGPRALLPLVTVTTKVTATRLLNQDAKTVARLLVEHPVLAEPINDSASRLAPRLTIAEVRGYSGPARRAARVIGEFPGFAPAGSDLLTEALAAVGRRPVDYTGKVDADITAGMPSTRQIRFSICPRLETAAV